MGIIRIELSYVEFPLGAEVTAEQSGTETPPHGAIILLDTLTTRYSECSQSDIRREQRYREHLRGSIQAALYDDRTFVPLPARM